MPGGNISEVAAQQRLITGGCVLSPTFAPPLVTQDDIDQLKAEFKKAAEQPKRPQEPFILFDTQGRLTFAAAFTPEGLLVFGQSFIPTEHLGRFREWLASE